MIMAMLLLHCGAAWAQLDAEYSRLTGFYTLPENISLTWKSIGRNGFDIESQFIKEGENVFCCGKTPLDHVFYYYRQKSEDTYELWMRNKSFPDGAGVPYDSGWQLVKIMTTRKAQIDLMRIAGGPELLFKVHPKGPHAGTSGYKFAGLVTTDTELMGKSSYRRWEMEFELSKDDPTYALLHPDYDFVVQFYVSKVGVTIKLASFGTEPAAFVYEAGLPD